MQLTILYTDTLEMRQKPSYAPGFNPSWKLYQLHHVCLRGGGDGIYAGMAGIPQQTQPHTESQLTIEEWNDYIGSRFNSPLSAFIMDESHFNNKKPPIRFLNSTLFANCTRQSTASFNPSHLLVSVGYLRELSSCLTRNLGRSRVFKNDVQLPFKQFFMHQCPSPEKSNWQWGRTMMELVYNELAVAYMVKKNSTMIFRRGKEASDTEVLCFDDLYLSSRQGHWIEGMETSIKFRQDVALKIGEPVAALELSERDLEFSSATMHQSYCTLGEEKPTSAKIKLFQRTESASPRTIVNINDVVTLLQKYTSIPVEVMTTTEKMSMKEQIKLFNSYDILITTHGSHMANGIFTMHPYTKAVVEIVPYVYDNIFFRSYVQDLGFSEYIISSGHLTPTPTVASGNKTFCAFLKFSDFTTRQCKLTQISNPPRVSQNWYNCAAAYHSRSCNTFVNLTILESHLNTLIYDSLCKNMNAGKGSKSIVDWSAMSRVRQM
jgi:hypothetical protein